MYPLNRNPGLSIISLLSYTMLNNLFFDMKTSVVNNGLKFLL